MTLLAVMFGAAGSLISQTYYFFASQPPLRLFLWFQAFLLLAYSILAVAAAFVLPSTFQATLAIRIPNTSREKVWDHILDVTKNPISGKMHWKTTLVSENEWIEELGQSERVVCKTTEQDKPSRIVRTMWAEAVFMKGQWIYVLSSSSQKENEPDESKQQKDDTTPTTETTILRIYATVEAKWGSFMTPLLRFVMYNTKGVEQGVDDYLKCLCHDMGVQDYSKAEDWE